MCLKTITKRSPRQRAVRVAYKLVFAYERELVVRGVYRRERILSSRWTKATSQKLMSLAPCRSYMSGFHVFARQKDAERNAYGCYVIPVKVRGIHTVGRQWRAEVWVAREMFVSVVDVRRALAAASK